MNEKGGCLWNTVYSL